MQGRRVRPHIVKRHATVGVNQICRISQAAVNLMRRSLQVVNDYRIRNVFFLFESLAIAPGELAPDFELPQVGGGSVRLSDLRGKPTILHFGSYS